MLWANPPHFGPGEEKKGKGQSVSNVEVERQQILEEMKKRTQLLTDNSWIRQRNSSSVYKEPIYVGFPLKRCVCSIFTLLSTGCCFVVTSHLCCHVAIMCEGLSLWTTWTLCDSPHTGPLRSVTLVRTQLLLTVPPVETPPLATALDLY